MLRLIIACAYLVAAWPGSAVAVSYALFDIPGAVNGLTVQDIGARGDIVGDWTDSAGHSHGFLRNAAGQIVSFDAPGVSTHPTGVNAAATVVGYYYASNVAHGFVRSADGRVVPYDIPNSYNTSVSAINNVGAFAGYFTPRITPVAYPMGFIGTVRKNLVPFGTPRRDSLVARAINDRSDVAGTYDVFGYVRLADGTSSTFDAPGGTKGLTETFPTAINLAREIVGYAYQQVCSGINCITVQPRSFIRLPNGALLAFNVPGSSTFGTFAEDLNNAGTIVGYFYFGRSLQSQHGFLRTARGQIVPFDVPGMARTIASAIDDHGVIAGTCVDASRVQHGFVRLP